MPYPLAPGDLPAPCSQRRAASAPAAGCGRPGSRDRAVADPSSWGWDGAGGAALGLAAPRSGRARLRRACLGRCVEVVVLAHGLTLADDVHAARLALHLGVRERAEAQVLHQALERAGCGRRFLLVC